MGYLQSDEQVDVIGHPAYGLRYASLTTDRAAEIIMQPGTPFGRNERLMIPSSKNKMIIQAEIG